MMSIKDRLSGNEAVATAMRQINPDVFAMFPITPSTEIPQYFARRGKDLGPRSCRVVQPPLPRRDAGGPADGRLAVAGYRDERQGHAPPPRDRTLARCGQLVRHRGQPLARPLQPIPRPVRLTQIIDRKSVV